MTGIFLIKLVLNFSTKGLQEFDLKLDAQRTLDAVGNGATDGEGVFATEGVVEDLMEKRWGMFATGVLEDLEQQIEKLWRGVFATESVLEDLQH